MKKLNNKHLLLMAIASIIGIGAHAQASTLQVNSASTDARAIVAPGSAVLPGPTDGFVVPRVNRFPATAPAATANGMMLYLQVAYTTTATPPPGASAFITYPIGYYFWTGSTGSPATTWQPFTNSNGTQNTNVFTNGAPTGTGSTGIIYTDTLSTSTPYGKQYLWNGSAYVTYTSPSQTPFYINSTTADAGANKYSAISRTGSISVNNGIFFAGILGNGNATNGALSGDGGVSLFRSASASTPNTNGYIDFRSHPTGAQDFRLNWDHSLGSTGGFVLGTSTNYLMTILNNGNVGMGTSSPIDALDVVGSIGANGFITRTGVNGTSNGHNFNINWDGTGAQIWIDNSNFGYISTTSDRRLKENIKPIALSGISLVEKLKPVSFKRRNIANTIFTGNGKEELGFIADELQEVIPSAVNGEKNALTKDGKLQPQSLAWAPIVSVLTKAIQEQQAEITELKAAILKLTKLDK